MNMSSSRRRFHQRIALERSVLADVNGTLTVTTPLSGITEESVLRWLSNVQVGVAPSNAERIAVIINEIAKRVSLDTDCSRDVFEDGELLPIDSIGELLIRLKEEVKASSQTRR